MPRRVVPIAVIALEDSRSASSSRCSGRISVTFSAIRKFSGPTATPWLFSLVTSSRNACGSTTTPLPFTESFDGRNTPDCSRASLSGWPLITWVWPALLSPWKRTTMSACSDNQSTILPFPSSPHWAPTTTTLAISQVFPLQLFLHEHDRLENRSRLRDWPKGLFPDHAPSPKHGRGRSHARHPTG